MACVPSSLVRGPGVIGEAQISWNIVPAVVSEFEVISGTVTFRDRQSAASIILKVLDVDHGVCKKCKLLSVPVYYSLARP